MLGYFSRADASASGLSSQMAASAPSSWKFRIRFLPQYPFPMIAILSDMGLLENVDGRGSQGELGKNLCPVAQATQHGGVCQGFRHHDGIAGIQPRGFETPAEGV